MRSCVSKARALALTGKWRSPRSLVCRYSGLYLISRRLLQLNNEASGRLREGMWYNAERLGIGRKCKVHAKGLSTYSQQWEEVQTACENRRFFFLGVVSFRDPALFSPHIRSEERRVGKEC